MSNLTDNNTSLNNILNTINELPNAITIDTTLTQAGQAADAKATGDAINGITLTSLGVTATATELNYVDGVTSAIQTQLNAKAASSHNQAASTVTAGTFAGAVVAQTSSQAPGTSLLRNSKIAASATNPSYNGEICWTYE